MSPLKVRRRGALVPATGFASQAWFPIFLIGIFMQATQLALIGVALFAAIVVFQLVTLPVEFDASRRAKRQLSDLGLVASNEATGVQATLKAAAWTYVAAALAAVAVLLYYLSMLSNR